MHENSLNPTRQRFSSTSLTNKHILITYFNMNVLYRIFNIILKSVFDLLSRIHL